MNYSLAMSAIERFRQFMGQLERGFQRQPPVFTGKQLVERLSPYKFHHDVRSPRLRFLAHVEDGDNSGMRKATCSFRFAVKALAILLFVLRGLPG